MMTTMMIMIAGTKDDWKCSGDKALYERGKKLAHHMG
jgi:hypothetical protein